MGFNHAQYNIFIVKICQTFKFKFCAWLNIVCYLKILVLNLVQIFKIVVLFYYKNVTIYIGGKLFYQVCFKRVEVPLVFNKKIAVVCFTKKREEWEKRKRAKERNKKKRSARPKPNGLKPISYLSRPWSQRRPQPS